jgi:hypothetical protein
MGCIVDCHFTPQGKCLMRAGEPEVTGDWLICELHDWPADGFSQQTLIRAGRSRFALSRVLRLVIA